VVREVRGMYSGKRRDCVLETLGLSEDLLKELKNRVEESGRSIPISSTRRQMICCAITKGLGVVSVSEAVQRIRYHGL